MKRPKQLPAVDRNAMRIATVLVGANVRPSGYFDELSPYFSSMSPYFSTL
jgi:hypothetical protein